MNSIAALLQLWEEQRMDLDPPASRSELARLASVLGAPVPQDLEEFYRRADGMRDPEMDR
jgi:hypothetical protein